MTTTNSFIGRRHELETLRAQATDPQTRLVTLVGPGGIGKTRLAVELVASVAPTFESVALEAAETICGAPVFDGLVSLVDKALLRPDHSVHGEPRFAMREVVREFATGRLEGAGEAGRLRQQHATYFRQLTVDIGAAVAGRPKVRPLVQPRSPTACEAGSVTSPTAG